jgi:hypothetical protein
MPAVDDRSHVDVDDVAVLEGALFARNAVAHDMVDRDAAALGVAAVAERRGEGAGVDRHPVNDVVQHLRRNAGRDVRHERVEDLGGEAAGFAHSGEAFGPMQLDDAALGFDAIVSGDGDVLSHELLPSRAGANLHPVSAEIARHRPSECPASC